MTACASTGNESVLARPQPCDHLAYLYLDSDSLCTALAQYVRGAIERDEAAIIIAIPAHMASLASKLEQAGHDCAALRARGQLAYVDAEELLLTIMREQEPDRAAFLAAISPILEAARRDFRGVNAYGELVNLLWERNNRSAAHQLEAWWNELIEQEPFSLLCGYVVDIFDNDAQVQTALNEVCHAHSHVIPEDQHARLDGALDAALLHALPNADVPALKKSLLARRCNGTNMPPAQVVLMALHELFPGLAQHVRMLAREYYNRG